MEESPREVEVLDGIVLSNELCLCLPEERLVAIADLHLGYEAVLHEEGVAVPHLQRRIIHERLERILERYEPETLVVVGDLKHQFSRNMGQEWDEVTGLLDQLAGRVRLEVVRGNHDNYLATILSRYGLEMHMEHEIAGLRFLHGHKVPSAHFRGITVIAHEHPSIRLRDDVGIGIKLPCFLVFPERGTIVLPAFSPLASGTEVYPDREGFLSPILKGMADERFEVFATFEEGVLELKNL